MKKKCFPWILLVFLIAGCSVVKIDSTKTQLQIREFQTRTYDTKDIKLVMKAMLNVLHYEGFIVKNASLDLGLISATKEADVSSRGGAFLSTLFMGKNATWQKNSIIESSANVSEFGEKCRVRIIFQVKVMDNKGEVMTVKQIVDGKYYQNFFAKVDKGLFLEKEKI